MPATVWTSEREAAFLAALRATRSVKAACAAAGVDRATAYRRRLANASFLAAWDRAWTEAADATEVAMSAILADPAASSAAKIRAAAALRSARRFRDKPWGSGVAAKAARTAGKVPTEPVEASPEPVPAEVAARIEKARTAAAEALEPFRARLPAAAYAGALSLATAYNAIFAARGMALAPHLVPIVIALADETIRNLLVIAGPGCGKSGVVSVAYPLWVLGEKDAAMTALLISAGESLVASFQGSIAEIIEHNAAYGALYPHVQPDKERGWSSERGLFTTGHAAGDPDSSVFATGVASSALTGRHARLVVCDDVHDKANSATAAQCESVISQFHVTILGRGDPRGARFVVCGRRFSESDLYGVLAESGNWVAMTLPAEREGQELFWDIEIPNGLACALSGIVEPASASEIAAEAPVDIATLPPVGDGIEGLAP